MRGLGLLIVIVLVIGGMASAAIVSWLEYPQLEVSFFFLPWAAIAAVVMILAWVVLAVVALIRSRRARIH